MKIKYSVVLLSLIMWVQYSVAFELSDTPAPFKAKYIAQYDGKTLKGTRSLELKNNTLTLTTTVKNMLVNITEKSVLNIDETFDIKPESYLYKRRILGIKKTESRRFDWQEQSVLFDKNGDKGTYSIPVDVVDKAAQQIVISDLLKQGKTTFSLNVADRDKLKKNTYTVATSEQLALSTGTVNAIKVVKTKNKSQDKRHTVMWFLPEQNFQLARLDQTEKNGKVFSLILKSLKTL